MHLPSKAAAFEHRLTSPKTFLNCGWLTHVRNHLLTFSYAARAAGSKTCLKSMRRLQHTQISASVTRSPTKNVLVSNALFRSSKHFLMCATAFSCSCLLNCFKPRVGNTQVQADGRISLSAKLMYCCTRHASNRFDP